MLFRGEYPQAAESTNEQTLLFCPLLSICPPFLLNHPVLASPSSPLFSHHFSSPPWLSCSSTLLLLLSLFLFCLDISPLGTSVHCSLLLTLSCNFIYPSSPLPFFPLFTACVIIRPLQRPSGGQHAICRKDHLSLHGVPQICTYGSAQLNI